MRKSKLFAILLLLLVGFYSCKKQDMDGKIEIGVILPMTGELASFGKPMKIGMDIAIEKLKVGGSKYQFSLKVVDSKAEASTAISGLQKLLNIDKIHYFIGDVSSPVTLAIVPIIEKEKVFLLSPGASSPKLNNISPYFARNYPSSISESKASAEFIFKEKRIKKTAVIFVNSDYGIGLESMFRKTYNELGGKIIYSEAYDVGKRDFRDILSKIRQIKPQAIYLGGNPKEMGIFIKQLKESRQNPFIISNISFLQSDCLNIAGHAANGVVVPVAYYNPSDSSMKSAYEFSKLYQNKYNKEVTIPVAVGYDAVMLIANSINKFDDFPEKVAENIRNLKNYNGALGVLNFTDGDVSMPIEFKVVEDGKVRRLLVK